MSWTRIRKLKPTKLRAEGVDNVLGFLAQPQQDSIEPDIGVCRTMSNQPSERDFGHLPLFGGCDPFAGIPRPTTSRAFHFHEHHRAVGIPADQIQFAASMTPISVDHGQTTRDKEGSRSLLAEVAPFLTGVALRF